jgi:hypothetical protein
VEGDDGNRGGNGGTKAPLPGPVSVEKELIKASALWYAKIAAQGQFSAIWLPMQRQDRYLSGAAGQGISLF